MSQSTQKDARMRTLLIRSSMLWIRGALFATLLLAGWYFLKTTIPGLEGYVVGGTSAFMVLVALVVVPPVLGYLGVKLLRPVLGKWQTAGGLLRWEERIVKELAPDEQRGFPVVLVPWPSPLRTVGFVTNTYDGPDGELAAVFLPNSPDPRKGWLRIVRQSDLEYTRWTFADLIQFQLSYGSSSPVTLTDALNSSMPTELPESMSSA